MSNKSIPSEPHGVHKWATVGRVIGYCLCCAVTLAAASGITQGMGNVWSPLTALFLAIFITLGLTLLFTRWENLPLKDIGVMPGKYSIVRIIAGFGIGLVLAALQPLILLLFTSRIKLQGSAQINTSPVIAAFFIYLLVAVREEIAFRGYPLRSLDKVLGPWTALAITALIFSLEHVAGGMTWRQALLGAGAGALLFGVAALATKGLAVPIGLHAAWNFGQWALGFKDNTGIWHAVVTKGYEARVEQLGFVSYWLVMILGIAGFCIYWRKKIVSQPKFSN